MLTFRIRLDRSMYSKYMEIYDWLHENMGVKGVEWDYHTILGYQYIAFKRRADRTAFVDHFKIPSPEISRRFT